MRTTAIMLLLFSSFVLAYAYLTSVLVVPGSPMNPTPACSLFSGRSSGVGTSTTSMVYGYIVGLYFSVVILGSLIYDIFSKIIPGGGHVPTLWI